MAEFSRLVRRMPEGVNSITFLADLSKKLKLAANGANEADVFSSLIKAVSKAGLPEGFRFSQDAFEGMAKFAAISRGTGGVGAYLKKLAGFRKATPPVLSDLAMKNMMENLNTIAEVRRSANSETWVAQSDDLRRFFAEFTSRKSAVPLDQDSKFIGNAWHAKIAAENKGGNLKQLVVRDGCKDGPDGIFDLGGGKFSFMEAKNYNRANAKRVVEQQLNALTTRRTALARNAGLASVDDVTEVEVHYSRFEGGIRGSDETVDIAKDFAAYLSTNEKTIKARLTVAQGAPPNARIVINMYPHAGTSSFNALMEGDHVLPTRVFIITPSQITYPPGLP